MFSFNQIMQAGQQITRIAAQAYDTLINQTVDYAKEVRDLSKNLMTSTEEASRLIQVADDYQISVGSLTSSLQFALKNGFAPTVNNLADLADKYLAIQSPTERAAMLTKIFGRNWSELTPLLNAGGDAIKKNAAAIEEGLVLTQQQVINARQLELALDGLEDSWKSTTTTIGNDLIPALTNTISRFDLHNRASRQAMEEARLLGKGYAWVDDRARVLEQDMYALELRERRFASNTREASYATEGLANKMSDGKKIIEDTTIALNNADNAVRLLNGFMSSDAPRRYKDIFAEITELVGESTVGAEEHIEAIEEIIDQGGTWEEKMRKIVQYYDHLTNKNIMIGIDYYERRALPMPVIVGGGAVNTTGTYVPGVGWVEGPGAQHGANFIVPPGFPNDSFPLRVESGEHVQVTPAGQTAPPGGGSFQFFAPVTFKIPDNLTAASLMKQLGVKNG